MIEGAPGVGFLTYQNPLLDKGVLEQFYLLVSYRRVTLVKSSRAIDWNLKYVYLPEPKLHMSLSSVCYLSDEGRFVPAFLQCNTFRKVSPWYPSEGYQVLYSISIQTSRTSVSSIDTSCQHLIFNHWAVEIFKSALQKRITNFAFAGSHF